MPFGDEYRAEPGCLGGTRDLADGSGRQPAVRCDRQPEWTSCDRLCHDSTSCCAATCCAATLHGDLRAAASCVRSSRLSTLPVVVRGRTLGELDRLRALEVGEAVPAPGRDLRRRGGRVRCRDDDRVHGLAPGRIWPADDRDVGHRRMLREHRLDLGRVDVLPAADDHVLGPVQDVEVAVSGQAGDVAGPVPAAVGERSGGGLGIAPVPGEQALAADQQLAGGLGGQVAAIRCRRCAPPSRTTPGPRWPGVDGPADDPPAPAG